VPINAAQLVATVSVLGVEQSVANLLKAAMAADTAGGKLTKLGELAVVAVVGTGIASIKMAGDFQAGMTSLVTGAGESEKNLKAVSDGILKMAVSTGTSTSQLVAGMYMIESAGFHGAAGLAVLQAAAEGAKVGNADLAAMANVVTSALNAYHLQGTQAAMVTNTLIATVASGKMHMQDLAGAMANILAPAQASGVSLQEVGAALATMTMQGTNASNAATYLKQMFIALDAPSSKAIKTFTDIGLSSTQVSLDMRKTPNGLITTLAEINTALDKKFPASAAVAVAEFAKVKAGHETMDQALANLANNTAPAYVDALKNISGGSRNMMAMLELTGGNLKNFQANLDNITQSVKTGGNTITGWNLVQQDFNQKMDVGRAIVETLGIKIGTALLPMVTNLLDQVTPLAQGFSTWIDKSGVLTTGTKELGIILGDVQGDIKSITNVVVPFVDGIVGAVEKSGLFQEVLKTITNIAPDVSGFFNTAGADLNNNLLPPLESLITNVGDIGTEFVAWLNQSGLMHDSLQVLGVVVGDTSVVLGTLVGWTADIVGLFDKGGPATDYLAASLEAVAGAMIAMKIVEFVGNIKDMIGNIVIAGQKFLEFAGIINGQVAGSVTTLSDTTLPRMQASLATTDVAIETTAAEASTVPAQMSLWGPASVKAATEVDGSLATVKASEAGAATGASGLGIAIGNMLPMLAAIYTIGAFQSGWNAKPGLPTDAGGWASMLFGGMPYMAGNSANTGLNMLQTGQTQGTGANAGDTNNFTKGTLTIGGKTYDSGTMLKDLLTSAPWNWNIANANFKNALITNTAPAPIDPAVTDPKSSWFGGNLTKGITDAIYATSGLNGTQFHQDISQLTSVVMQSKDGTISGLNSILANGYTLGASFQELDKVTLLAASENKTQQLAQILLLAKQDDLSQKQVNTMLTSITSGKESFAQVIAQLQQQRNQQHADSVHLYDAVQKNPTENNILSALTGSTGTNSTLQLIATYSSQMSQSIVQTNEIFRNGFGKLAVAPGHAAGTSSSSGGPHWVGEEGPEIMNLPRGTSITPHAQSMAMASGGSSGGGSQALTFEMDGRTIARMLLPYIVSEIRSKVGTHAY
jgi:TP901 family phage tail tape measure protein